VQVSYSLEGLTHPRFHMGTGSVTNPFPNRVCAHYLGIEEKIPIWECFPYGDCHFHMVIPIWKQAGRLRNSHLGTPHSQTEFVPIWGLTCTCWYQNVQISITGNGHASTRI
jgi:hypothetical protein